MADPKRERYKVDSSRLKLVITGQGSTEGRQNHLLRLRPTLVQALKERAQGQLYLVMEMAIQSFIESLDRQEEKLIAVQASDLAASPEDIAMSDALDAKKDAFIAAKKEQAKTVKEFEHYVEQKILKASVEKKALDA
ncbi:MAG: hypothetical protein IPN53_05630 [Comamonadaceae bacterium]|nr:hypothetical protein [Comamonadaceae bacterium]